MNLESLDILFEIIHLFSHDYQSIINLAHCSKVMFKKIRYVIQNAYFEFNFRKTHISNNDLKLFRGVKNIILDFCHQIDDQGIINLCDKKQIDPTIIVGDGVNTIIPLDAISVSLIACKKITNNCVPCLCNTKSVSLAYTFITDDALKHLVNCGHIDLSCCKNI
jgi:hypothetical protein